MKQVESVAGEKAVDVQVDHDSYTASESELKLSGWERFKDSFRRQDQGYEDLDPDLSDVERAAILTARAPLSRTLQGRHLQMIAIGGSIGTGLFVGAGSKLSTGGPAGVLIAYSLIGSLTYVTCQAVGELTVTFPVAGAYITFPTRFIDPSWGFAMSWNVAMSCLIGFPLELVAASMTIRYWNPDVNPAAIIVVFYVFICSINFFGVKGYGEAEFVFSSIKITAIIGFILFGIIVVCGGGPSHEYLGARYFHDPGAFANGFKGVCAVFVSAAYSFAGTEAVGLVAAETENPRKTIPKATKQVFWRVLLFYIISLLMVGLLVPYTDPRLLSGSSFVDAKASPFVLAIVDAGVKGLPSVINAVILVAVLSVGNADIFIASRVLSALAAANHAPKIFGYIDKNGRPLFGIIAASLTGALCFLVGTGKDMTIFNWLLSVSGLSALFNWGSICLCHIRVRRALKSQGRSTDELAFTAQTGEYGSYYGIILCILVIIAQFWVALFPIGGKPNAADFFMAYLSFPIVLFFYVSHKIWHKNWRLYIRAKDIDVDTGRRDTDFDLLKQELAEERKELSQRSFLYRTWNFWC